MVQLSSLSLKFKTGNPDETHFRPQTRTLSFNSFPAGCNLNVLRAARAFDSGSGCARGAVGARVFKIKQDEGVAPAHAVDDDSQLDFAPGTARPAPARLCDRERASNTSPTRTHHAQRALAACSTEHSRAQRSASSATRRRASRAERSRNRRSEER